jgi:hypothetical protein
MGASSAPEAVGRVRGGAGSDVGPIRLITPAFASRADLGLDQQFEDHPQRLEEHDQRVPFLPGERRRWVLAMQRRFAADRALERVMNCSIVADVPYGMTTHRTPYDTDVRDEVRWTPLSRPKSDESSLLSHQIHVILPSRRPWRRGSRRGKEVEPRSYSSHQGGWDRTAFVQQTRRSLMTFLRGRGVREEQDPESSQRAARAPRWCRAGRRLAGR